jgi:sn-glycerol 3-phosphate transport system substrate-binding protein
MKKYAMGTLVAALALTSALTSGALAQGSRTEIQFWHSMGGVLGEQVEGLVKSFNDSQNSVTVKSSFVGSYDDGINKLLAGMRSNKVPNVIQVYDIGSRTMVDSGAIEPLENIAKANGFDLEKYVPQPRNYYTVDGKLNAMPFNSSNPLLYFNAGMLAKAGITNRATWKLSELEAAARKLTIKDESGKTTRYGIVIPIDSWFVEQFAYNSGEYFCNNENGRKSRATEMSFTNPADVAFVDWWARMVKDGVMANVGRVGGDAQAAFAQERAAIVVQSTASLTGILKLVGGKFQTRTAFYPYLKERNGVAVGGASLYAMKGQSPEELKGTWAFVNFLLQPTNQAKWHLGTGYFPVIKGVNAMPNVVQAHVKQPNFETALRQLETSKVNNYSAGCLAGALPEIRQYVNAAIEEAIKGKPAAEALKDAKVKADAALERYNSSVK